MSSLSTPARNSHYIRIHPIGPDRFFTGRGDCIGHCLTVPKGAPSLTGDFRHALHHNYMVCRSPAFSTIKFLSGSPTSAAEGLLLLQLSRAWNAHPLVNEGITDVVKFISPTLLRHNAEKKQGKTTAIDIRHPITNM
jgi:hypothetical protein